MTLQGALRYDHVTSWAPGDKQGSTETSPLHLDADPLRDDAMSVRGYHDLNPRVGLAYDLFGNGKTALKVNVGRYLAAATADGVYSSQSPALKLRPQIAGANPRVDRRNGNFAVDCNLLSPAAQNPARPAATSAPALTGANLNFGNLDPNYDQIDPAILERLGRAAVQLAVRRVDAARSAAARLGRRRLQPSVVGQLLHDLQQAGRRERLRHVDGAGAEPSRAAECRRHRRRRIVAITPAAAARGSRNFQTKETNVARGAHGVLARRGLHGDRPSGRRRDPAGGGSTGRGVRNTCELWRARPQLQGSNRADACDVTEPWITSFRGLASYTLPEGRRPRQHHDAIDADHRQRERREQRLVARRANYQIPNTVVRTSCLGRLPAGALADAATRPSIC